MWWDSSYECDQKLEDRDRGSLGFDRATGKVYAEEEGPHSPSPTIAPMVVQGGGMGGTGPIENRIPGIKIVLWYEGNNVNVEG
jgi:hypothetical protein